VLAAAGLFVLLSWRKRGCATPARVDVEKDYAWGFDNPSRVEFEAARTKPNLGLTSTATSNTPANASTASVNTDGKIG
jgi:hypothetical protein